MSTTRHEGAAVRGERRARERAPGSAAIRRRRLWTVAALAGLAAVVVAAVVMVTRPEPAAPAPTRAPSTSMLTGIPQDGITLGDPAAPVTLIEYADVQCPFCAVFATGVLPSLIDRYVRTGQLKLELRLLAFLGEDSVEAARLAAATAAQDRLWQFSEQLFARQGAENSGWVTDALLRDAMSQVPGLDAEAALAAAGSPAATRLLENAARSARRDHIEGTPAFTLRDRDGEAVAFEPADLTPEAFSATLDAALQAR